MKKYILLMIIVLLMLPVTTSYAATYELTTGANARSCPQVSCGVVTRLAKGTVIEVTEVVEGDKYNGTTKWLKISVNGRTAYVHGSLAKLAAGALPPAAVSNNNSGAGSSTSVAPTAVPTEAPVVVPPPQQSLSCGNCSSMSSCDHARACLAAGHGDLDRDNDGVPCESICPGG